MFANILRDTRYALRQLVRTPAFTIVAVLTLGVGIGATSAIFSVVNGVLLRPLPYPNPDALVRVHEVLQKFGRFSVAPATFLDWRQQNTTFERLAAMNSAGATLIGANGAERISGGAVSWDMFDLLQVPPAMGRDFPTGRGSSRARTTSSYSVTARGRGDSAATARCSASRSRSAACR